MSLIAVCGGDNTVYGTVSRELFLEIFTSVKHLTLVADAVRLKESPDACRYLYNYVIRVGKKPVGAISREIMGEILPAASLYGIRPLLDFCEDTLVACNTEYSTCTLLGYAHIWRLEKLADRLRKLATPTVNGLSMFMIKFLDEHVAQDMRGQTFYDPLLSYWQNACGIIVRLLPYYTVEQSRGLLEYICCRCDMRMIPLECVHVLYAASSLLLPTKKAALVECLLRASNPRCAMVPLN